MSNKFWRSAADCVQTGERGTQRRGDSEKS